MLTCQHILYMITNILEHRRVYANNCITPQMTWKRMIKCIKMIKNANSRFKNIILANSMIAQKIKCAIEKCYLNLYIEIYTYAHTNVCSMKHCSSFDNMCNRRFYWYGNKRKNRTLIWNQVNSKIYLNI